MASLLAYSSSSKILMQRMPVKVAGRRFTSTGTTGLSATRNQSSSILHRSRASTTTTTMAMTRPTFSSPFLRSFGTAAITTSEFMNLPSPSEQDISKLIASYKVVLFSKQYCPFCSQAKQLFFQTLGEKEGETAGVVELDAMPNGKEIQATLLQMYGQSTVPFVFVNNTLVGGNSEAQTAAGSGKLQEMLLQEQTKPN